MQLAKSPCFKVNECAEILFSFPQINCIKQFNFSEKEKSLAYLKIIINLYKYFIDNFSHHEEKFYKIILDNFIRLLYKLQNNEINNFDKLNDYFSKSEEKLAKSSLTIFSTLEIKYTTLCKKLLMSIEKNNKIFSNMKEALLFSNDIIRQCTGTNEALEKIKMAFINASELVSVNEEKQPRMRV